MNDVIDKTSSPVCAFHSDMYGLKTIYFIDEKTNMKCIYCKKPATEMAEQGNFNDVFDD